MKLDTRVRLMGSLDLSKQGVEDSSVLNGITGTVIDVDDEDVQVAFEFDQGAYHGIYVWVNLNHVGVV